MLLIWLFGCFWLTEEIHALCGFHVHVGISLQEQANASGLCFSEINKTKELQGVE